MTTVFDTFVAKFTTDTAFQASFVADPQAALTSIGLTVTPQIRATLDTMKANGQLDSLAHLQNAMAHNMAALL